MRLFGLQITKAGPFAQVPSSRGTWWPTVHEPYTGAWQRNVEWTTDSVLSYHAVFACITLISQDFGKLRPKLVRLDEDGIWSETSSAAFSPVLKKPNRYQNHIQFKEWWIISKLIRGNTYALKVRDDRRVVTSLYLLDPSRVKVLVAPDGSVYYELTQDNLSGLEKATITVPASEIIHDRMNCLFHPLVGVSPIFACGTAANLGLRIQNSSSGFFANGANPGGVLTAPGKITQDTADRLKAYWQSEFAGDNSGKVAVLGEGLTFEAMRMTSVDAQLIEQGKWSAETVCSTFHVPGFKVGIGPTPTYQNAEVMNQIYYSDCLQSHIESFELCLDEGLGLDETKDGKVLGVELDLDALLRMDTATQIKSLAEGIGGALLTPNEARMKIDKKPLTGGDTVYLQQQQYGIQALFERDQDKPFSKPSPAAAGAPALPPAAAPLALPSGKDAESGADLALIAVEYRKAMRMAA